jgi:hypothetical protein
MRDHGFAAAFFNKQGTLMRGSAVLILPFQLVFLAFDDFQLFRSMLDHSVLTRIDLLEGRRRDPENLPSLGSIEFAGDVIAGLLETSPFAFLNSVLAFVKSSIRYRMLDVW